MERSAVITPQDQWTRVVVLAPTAGAPHSSGTSANVGAVSLSPDLQSQFTQRDWFAIEHHDPYLALAELCLRDRAQAARAAWGLQRMEKIALVILHPQRWPQQIVADLTRAVQRHMPDAAVFFADESHIEGVPDAAAPLGAMPQPTIEAAHNGQSGPRSDHSFSARPATPAVAPAAPAGDAAAPQRISRDEIDMLLRLEDALDSDKGAGEQPR